MDCNDIGCRTNDPDSKVICTKCLKLVLDNLTVEELYDVYYYIYDLLGMSPKVREALEAIFGKRPLRDIESFKEKEKELRV